MGAIYRIWNTENGKSYIGQSSRPYHRIIYHFTAEWSGGSKQIRSDLLKYDPDVWEWEIIADEKDYPGVTLDELEIRFIEKWDSLNKGYNASRGGGVGASKPTESETHLNWKGERFDRSEMRARIKWEITYYQFNTNLHQLREDTIEKLQGMLNNVMQRYPGESWDTTKRISQLLQHSLTTSMQTVIRIAVSRCVDWENRMQVDWENRMQVIRNHFRSKSPLTKSMQESHITGNEQQKPDGGGGGCAQTLIVTVMSIGFVLFMMGAFSRC